MDIVKAVNFWQALRVAEFTNLSYLGGFLCFTVITAIAADLTISSFIISHEKFIMQFISIVSDVLVNNR